MQTDDTLIQPESLEGCLSNWYQNISHIIVAMGINVCALKQGIFLFRYWSKTQQLRLFRIWQSSAQWCELSIANFDFWPSLEPSQMNHGQRMSRMLMDGWVSLSLTNDQNLTEDASDESSLLKRFDFMDVRHPLLSMPLTQCPVKITKYESDLLSISYQVLRHLKTQKNWYEFDCAQALLMTPQYVFGGFQRYLMNHSPIDPLVCFPILNGQADNQAHLSVAQSIALTDMFLHKVNRGEHPLEVFTAITKMPIWRVYPELVTAFHCVLLRSNLLNPI